MDAVLRRMSINSGRLDAVSHYRPQASIDFRLESYPQLQIYCSQCADESLSTSCGTRLSKGFTTYTDFWSCTVHFDLPVKTGSGEIGIFSLSRDMHALPSRLLMHLLTMYTWFNRHPSSAASQTREKGNVGHSNRFRFGKSRPSSAFGC